MKRVVIPSPPPRVGDGKWQEGSLLDTYSTTLIGCVCVVFSNKAPPIVALYYRKEMGTVGPLGTEMGVGMEKASTATNYIDCPSRFDTFPIVCYS